MTESHIESRKRPKVTVPGIAERKNGQSPISMITAYDAMYAAIVDEAGVDMILVGDSVATVMQGARTTLPVTMDQMEYHVRMVASAEPRALIVGDMPFGSYQASIGEAVTNAVRLIKAGAEAVKLEGGVHVAPAVAAIARADIPVVGHIGLTPQSYHRMGGNKVQGRISGENAGSRERILDDAHAVDTAGAFALVIEGVPSSLAGEITDKVSIPTIGIGAGPRCDGQVLVLHDVLGLSPRRFTFAKAYAELRSASIEAVSRYVAEVQERTWPDDAHSFH